MVVVFAKVETNDLNLKHKCEICEMSALIVAATEMEMAPFRNQFPDAAFLITGVGAPIAIYRLTQRLIEQKHDAVFQVGIAGTYVSSLALGDAVVVERDCFADLGVHEGKDFVSLFDMGFASPDEYPFLEGWLVNRGVNDFLPLPSIVSAATVNTLTTNKLPQLSSAINNAVSIESMEGACLHYVALQQRIPFLQIRGISNSVGERDKELWKIEEAVMSSNRLLMEVYQRRFA